MSEANETNGPLTNMERLKEQASACGPGCDCHAGPSHRARWLVGAIIIVAAGVLVVRAVSNHDSASVAAQNAGFTPPSINGTTATAAADQQQPRAEGAQIGRPAFCGEWLQSLGDLNRTAKDRDGVFVFLPGRDSVRNRDVATAIEAAASSLRGRSLNMGVFTLADGSSEYTNIVRQVPPPGVIVIVKGRGTSAVRDNITESRLIQAFVAASSAGGGCCPTSGASSSGCK